LLDSGAEPSCSPHTPDNAAAARPARAKRKFELVASERGLVIFEHPKMIEIVRSRWLPGGGR
jgi:hypothetical protein